MSLVGLLIFEFIAWVAFNRSTPFSISRTTVAVNTTLGFTAASIVVLGLWMSTEQLPFIALEPLTWFAAINTILALSLFAASRTVKVS